jgi:hypothetical protein
MMLQVLYEGLWCVCVRVELLLMVNWFNWLFLRQHATVDCGMELMQECHDLY